MGFPSFEMGAEGAEVALEWASLLSLGSTVSFKLRIFLIETDGRCVLVWRATETVAGLQLGDAYESACRAASSPAPPWLAWEYWSRTE